jgi:hypothetical protein
LSEEPNDPVCWLPVRVGLFQDHKFLGLTPLTSAALGS